MNNKNSKWEEDFKEFLSIKSYQPTNDISRKIRTSVFDLLNPSPCKVFAKVVTIVFLMGLINLLLCPQFGLGFIRESYIADLFMTFGHIGCKFACGAFFLGSSLFVGTLFLKPEEIKVIRAHRFLQITLLSSLALAGFVAAGADIFIQAMLFWLIGSVLGGIMSLEIAFAIRTFLLKNNLSPIS